MALEGCGVKAVSLALGVSYKSVENLFAKMRKWGRVPPRRPGDRGGGLPRRGREDVLQALELEGYPSVGAVNRAALRLGYTPGWLSQRLTMMRSEDDEGS